MTIFKVQSPNVDYTDEKYIYSQYTYSTTRVKNHILTPQHQHYLFQLDRKLPKTGLLLVGWGGNNGTTLTASLIAHKKNIKWETREGIQTPNFYGSLMMASTMKLGVDEKGQEVYCPLNEFLPTLNPNDLVIGGWDISGKNLAEAMEDAKVLEPDLKRQVYEEMKQLKPMPSIYSPDFIAPNQKDRATHIMKAETHSEKIEQIRTDIKTFKKENQLDQVIVLWTATTERYSYLLEGVNDTAQNFMTAIKQNHSEISPSSLFATACILEKTPFINGSPQNTFVPGVIQLAEQHQSLIMGDDFKSGQTKMKAVLAEFLINAGIKPLAITSYNHLGNNDGRNLSNPPQFKSKEISKSGLVEDLTLTNQVLFPSGEVPDHTIVIKYVPAVGDSKRALDEYYSEIFMGGRNTMAIHNTCEDSLLAAPLMLDLCLFTELFSRVKFCRIEKPVEKVLGSQFQNKNWLSLGPILSILGYMLKAPLAPAGQPVVQALGRQRKAIENLLRALVGLEPVNDLLLEQFTEYK